MHAFAKIGLLVTLGATVLAGRRSDAELMLMTVRAPKDLPDGLTVKSEKRASGMIAFDVAIDPEQVSHADRKLYGGRVKPNAVLIVTAGGEELGQITVQGTLDGKRTHYYFRLAPSAARTSELQLGVSLYEKDGHPTLGGGVSVQVHLAGFGPIEKAAKPAVKR